MAKQTWNYHCGKCDSGVVIVTRNERAGITRVVIAKCNHCGEQYGLKESDRLSLILKPQPVKTGAKKKNWELAADLKTMSDYAAVLYHIHGGSRKEAMDGAKASASASAPLYKELLAWNRDLFRTGEITTKL